MRKIYLATGYNNGINADGSTSLTFQRVQKALSDAGWALTFNWTKVPEMSDNKKILAACEINGVTEADVLGLILPGGRGAHWECGVASQCSIPIVILAENDEDLYREDGEYVCIFYNLPHVFVTKSVDQFVQALNFLYPTYYGEDDDEGHLL